MHLLACIKRFACLSVYLLDPILTQSCHSGLEAETLLSLRLYCLPLVAMELLRALLDIDFELYLAADY